MLKNKFGMTTRVLLIVLSVLMAVSLAACKKDDGISSDDMNSAIQSAIDAANKAQEEQNKALQSSIAAKEEAEAAQKAAEASSIAAQIKAQEDALKKAQEEADAAKKAAEAASKAAADAAAKAKAEAEQAAKDAAAKAASEAAKKAEESMKALESALKAQEEALKKAQEEAEAAKKAAEEASKRAEEAMSKAEETTVAPETTVVPATTPAETTVAPETTAPIVMEDKTDVLTAYSKLKTEYTYTKQAMYNAAEYAELVLLFDHASVELNNAVTLDAATSIYNTLVVDVAAVRNVANAAAEVAALVNALGDIETEVFTTQATKIKEAKDAYTALKKEYTTYFKAQIAADEKKQTTNDTVATKLGINVADLNKAIDKEAVLVSYIESALYEDMKTLFLGVNKKITSYDAEDDSDLHTTVNDAYYKYLVLSVVNGGDYGKGLEIDWEYLTVDGEKVLGADVDYLDPWGNSYGAKARVYDTEKAIEWFTVEELLDVFVLPTLDYKLALYIENEDETGLLNKFKAAVGDEGYFATKDAEDSIYVDIYSDIDNELNNVYEALEDELLALTFSEDFKGNVTFDDAKDEVAAIAIKAYIEALNVYFEEAKAIAIAAEEENVKNLIDGNEDLEIVGWQEKIDEVNAKLDADNLSAAAIERYNNTIAGYQAKIDKLNADLDAFKANVEAAALLTYEEMLTEEVAESDAYKTVWVDITKIHALYEGETEGVYDVLASTKIVTFLNKVLTETIAANFTSNVDNGDEDPTLEELNNLVDYVVTDLYALRDRVSPYAEDEEVADIFNKSYMDGETEKFYYRGDAYAYMGDYYFKNTPLFEEVVAIIDTAIEAIEAETADKYEDTDVQVPSSNGKKKLYFRSAAAQAYAVENEMTLDEIFADSTLWSDSTTDYPIYYVYTAAEQAAKKVTEIYVQAFTDVNAKIVTLDAYAAAQKKVISNSDAPTAYDKIVAAVSGTLKDEVKAVGTKYLNDITNAVTKFGNNSGLKVDAIFKQNTTKQSKIANMVKITVPTTSYAEDYNPQGYNKKINDAVANFKTNFFENGEVSENVSDCRVVTLWNLKLKAVEDIKTTMATYKNAFEPEYDEDNKATGLYTLKANEAGLYYYDGVEGDASEKEEGSIKENVASKSDAAIAYEEALDDLLVEYTGYIMGLELGDGTITIKDAMGGVMSAAQADDPATDDVDESKVVSIFNGAEKYKDADGEEIDDDYAHTQINYNMTRAKNAIQAYKNALFGTADYYVTANNDAKETKTQYDQGNSMIFKAFNTEILGNTYGYAKVAD